MSKKFTEFKVSSGVRKRTGNEFDDYRRDYVGWQGAVYDNKKAAIAFTVGRYGFGNSISATMFSHLNSCSDIPTEYAKQAIVRFEENLRDVGMLDKIATHTRGIDLGSAMVSHPIKKLLDAAAACADFAGGIYVKHFVKGNQFNMFPPTNAQGAKNYAQYALGFWHDHPHIGPAYILGRKSSVNTKSTMGKEFNPFGWK